LQRTPVPAPDDRALRIRLKEAATHQRSGLFQFWAFDESNNFIDLKRSIAFSAIAAFVCCKCFVTMRKLETLIVLIGRNVLAQQTEC